MTTSGVPAADAWRSEQGKLPTAKAFKLAERDEHMSEQKSFMQQLDDWSEEVVITPLLEEGPEVIEQVQKAIREKVLESYKNGCRAGAGAVRKEARNAQTQTR